MGWWRVLFGQSWLWEQFWSMPDLFNRRERP